MIKLEHVVLPSPEQMEFVIEGMRNPMNSWEKSDSSCGKATKDTNVQWNYDYFLGTNDADLMGRLSAAGTEHRKFMRMMPVYVRITAPLYWWKEFDTYKVGTVSNSCSTMHKITEKEFVMSDFSNEHIHGLTYRLIEDIIEDLNRQRKLYLSYKDPDQKKDAWWNIIQSLPSSYNQTRNVMLNYEVLSAVYGQRKNHKLDEWIKFCDWIETLPLHELITE